MLPKPVRCFRVIARVTFQATLVMIFAPLQLPSVHHNPSCDGCVRDTEEKRMWDSGGLREGLTGPQPGAPNI